MGYHILGTSVVKGLITMLWFILYLIFITYSYLNLIRCVN